jgi:hypothetical protein
MSDNEDWLSFFFKTELDVVGSYTEFECSINGSGDSLPNYPEVVAVVLCKRRLPPPEPRPLESCIFSKIFIK